jgi:hypothetical protein
MFTETQSGYFHLNYLNKAPPPSIPREREGGGVERIEGLFLNPTLGATLI